MKKFFLPIAMLVMAALAFGQDSAQPPKDLSGFSGYAWGASHSFVRQDMEKEGYDLVENGPNDLWYLGEILGGKVKIVYIFDDKLLTSGIWILDDIDQASFWEVNSFLRKTYNAKAKLKVRGNHLMESELMPAGTDARIIHRLDVVANRHEVHYYYDTGEE